MARNLRFLSTNRNFTMSIGHLCLKVVIIFGFLSIIGCGGGGGGDDSSPPEDPLEGLTYTGLTTAAVLTPEDVEDFMLFVQFSRLLFTDYVFSSGSILDEPVLDGYAEVLAAQVVESEPGSCGGLLRLDLNVNEATGAFDGSFIFEQYDDCDVMIDGTIRVQSGQINIETGELISGIFSFDLLTFTSAEGIEQTLSGTLSIENAWPYETAEYDIRMRDEDTGKVYWIENYRTTIFHGYDTRWFQEESISSGRYYDPDRGYVELNTLASIRTYDGDTWPFSGTLVVEASNNTLARLNIISPVLYQVEADLDGDGTFEFDTGSVHFPNANSLPTAFAGEDTIGNVGCPVFLDGSQSSDADLDALQFQWSLLSAPEGSSSQLSSTTTSTSTFIPDQQGDYLFLLSVSDGYDQAEDSFQLTVYGDLFCLDSKQLHSVAEYSKPSAVAIGDINGDGRNDVVLATSTFNTTESDPNQDYHLFVFTQNAQGQLLEPVSYPAGDGHSIGISDLNDDGRMDIAVTTSTGIGVFYQTTTGDLDTMQLLPFGETLDVYDWNRLTVADFTADGRADVVSIYSKYAGATIRLYTQTDVGLSDSPVLFTTDPGPWQPIGVDINNDLNTDLILTSAELGSGSVFMGVFATQLLQEGGTLTAPTSYLQDYASSDFDSARTSSMALGDFTGDGRPDLIASMLGDTILGEAWLHFYPQLPSGEPDTPVSLATPADRFYLQLTAYDITQEGATDLVAVESGNEMFIDIMRKEMPAEGGIWETYPLSLPNYNYSEQMLAIGDINSDGTPDIVAAIFVGTDGGTGLLILPGRPDTP